MAQHTDQACSRQFGCLWLSDRGRGHGHDLLQRPQGQAHACHTAGTCHIARDAYAQGMGEGLRVRIDLQRHQPALYSPAVHCHGKRLAVRERLVAGDTDDQVVAFMVARYGDFVLFRPPLKPSTYPLWFGPVILLLIAAFFLFRALGRKKSSPETALSEQEQARLAAMLQPEPEGRQETDK